MSCVMIILLVFYWCWSEMKLIFGGFIWLTRKVMCFRLLFDCFLWVFLIDVVEI